LKLKHVGIATTAMVIVAGCAMISPLFYHPDEPEPKQIVMLSFSVSESADVMGWCESLADLLFDYGIGASVFMVGKVAEEYPDALWYFGDEVDIGSQTYSNLDLTNIPDYSVKLEEVKEGKMVVDDVGTLSSKIFRAPFGATDRDIYSLLSRSGILADFSYENHYNVYQDGQFIKYDAVTYMAQDCSPGFFSTLAYTTKPVIIFFDNSHSISDVDRLISSLEEADVEFVNASELTGLKLRIRGT
jgi:peptidoglycan/xylan/chitin deacetylase (PgdA/CDA1 family)